MASAVAHRLARCQLKVCMTETEWPMAVRRGVAFCEAVFEGRKTVEGVTAVRVDAAEEIYQAWGRGEIALIVDPQAKIKEALKPFVIVDAILAKRNTGTARGDAPVVIGLGPGFIASVDVHAVIETNRGHDLGRVILEGEAERNTGVPGNIGGFTEERVFRAPRAGVFVALKEIGGSVAAGEPVGSVEGQPVASDIGGVLRGLIRDGTRVEKGLKMGDVDPRAARHMCFTISDKARAIAGGVLEAILMHFP